MAPDTSTQDSPNQITARASLITLGEGVVTETGGEFSIDSSDSHPVSSLEDKVVKDAATIEYKLSIPELRSLENIPGRVLARKGGYQVLRNQGSPNVASRKVKISIEQKPSPAIVRRSLIPTVKSGKTRQNKERHDLDGRDSHGAVDVNPALAQLESSDEVIDSPAEERLDSAVRRSTKYGIGPTMRVSENADEVIMGTGRST
jgi:hypothetical protein